MLASLVDLASLHQPSTINSEVKPLAVSLNDSPMAQLLLLPRVGVKTPLKIMTYRKGHRIRNANDLLHVHGIGPATIEDLVQLLEECAQ